jgi:hypothetical protein
MTRRHRFAWDWRAGAATSMALALLSPLPSALGAEFAVSASPPRFELKLKPGERSRQILEITNASAETSTLGIRTADWSLGTDNSVTFHEALQPGSCRPWVALERRELSVTRERPYRFRFEIQAPADTPPGECRFAIMLEGQEQVGHAAGGLDFPFTARLGVVVYVALGGAAPELSVVGAGVQSLNGKPTPVLQVRNSGTAHGRLLGFLSGTDAAQTALEFAPVSMPILPGETRGIALTATRPGDPDTQVQVQFPVTISGKLEWGNGQTQNIEQRFAQ